MPLRSNEKFNFNIKKHVNFEKINFLFKKFKLITF